MSRHRPRNFNILCGPLAEPQISVAWLTAHSSFTSGNFRSHSFGLYDWVFDKDYSRATNLGTHHLRNWKLRTRKRFLFSSIRSSIKARIFLQFYASWLFLKVFLLESGLSFSFFLSFLFLSLPMNIVFPLKMWKSIGASENCCAGIVISYF